MGREHSEQGKCSQNNAGGDGHHIIKLFLGFSILLSFFGSLFMVEIEVKVDFLLKNEVLPCKNVTLVYKGKNLKIQRNIGLKSVFAITFNPVA